MKDTIQLICDSYDGTYEWRSMLQDTIRELIESHYDSAIKELSAKIAIEERAIKKNPLNDKLLRIKEEISRKKKDLNKIVEMHNDTFTRDPYPGEMIYHERCMFKRNAAGISEVISRLEKQKNSITSSLNSNIRRLRYEKQNAKSYRNPAMVYIDFISAYIEFSISADVSDELRCRLIDSAIDVKKYGHSSTADRYLSILDLPDYSSIYEIIQEMISCERKKSISDIYFSGLVYSPNAYSMGIMEDYDRLCPSNMCRNEYYRIDVCDIREDVIRKGYASCIKLV